MTARLGFTTRLLPALCALTGMLFVAGAAKDPTTELYAPGALVTLAVQFDAPADWALNGKVPLKVRFDEKALSGAAFQSSKPGYDFKVDDHSSSYIAEIPIRVSKDHDGELTVPLNVACSICTLDETSCTFVSDEVRVNLRVAKNKVGNRKPQKQGTLRTNHVLSPPQ